MPGKKGKKNNLLSNLGAYGREHMTDKDWESKFELLLSEDLIDLPENLQREHLYFKDPGDLGEIFGELEEQNLYLIHRKQEIEHALETQTHQFKQLQGELGRTRDTHLANKIEL